MTKLYFKQHIPICPLTNKPNEHYFELRAYLDPNDIKYIAATIVHKRIEGWEPTAWVTNNHMPHNYHLQTMRWLEEMNYTPVLGTFEMRRLRAYKRMFRGHYRLEMICIKKNACEVAGTFAYIKFIKEN